MKGLTNPLDRKKALMEQFRKQRSRVVRLEETEEEFKIDIHPKAIEWHRNVRGGAYDE